MARRIVWNKQDKANVAIRSFEIKSAPGWADSDIEAVRLAMREIIKPEDWRDLTQMQHCDFVLPIWKDLFAAGLETKAAVQPIVAPRVERHVQEKHAASVTLDTFSTMDIMMEAMKRMADFMNPEKLRAMIRDEARAEANAVLDRRMPGMLPVDTYVPMAKEGVDFVEPGKKLIKVAVIGLQGGQRHILKTQYKDVIDFHFLEGSEGVRRVKNTVELMDYSFKTQWCKGNLDGLKVNNMTNVKGMDSIHRLLHDKFGVSRQV